MTQKRDLRRTWLLLGVMFASQLHAAEGRQTRVILDEATFPYSSRQVLQPVADAVAAVVDRLIPGQAPSYPPSGVFCFIAPAAWSKSIENPPPITLLGRARSGEPAVAARYPIRIALHRSVLPQAMPELVYELSHELAHVKMDPRFDNYLVETFAVRTSLKVLRECGLELYRRADIEQYTNKLPRQIRAAVAMHDWNTAVAYWQSEIPKLSSRPGGRWNFTFATLGALILEAAQQPNWPDLAGIALLSDDCAVPTGAVDADFWVCSPSINRMGAIAPALRALGYQ